MIDTHDHDPAFWDAYARLEAEGACDSPGGMEYQRVYREWLDANCPGDVDTFIRQRANVGPR